MHLRCSRCAQLRLTSRLRFRRGFRWLLRRLRGWDRCLSPGLRAIPRLRLSHIPRLRPSAVLQPCLYGLPRLRHSTILRP